MVIHVKNVKCAKATINHNKLGHHLVGTTNQSNQSKEKKIPLPQNEEINSLTLRGCSWIRARKQTTQLKQDKKNNNLLQI